MAEREKKNGNISGTVPRPYTGEAKTEVHPTISGMMHNYNKQFSEQNTSNVCKLAGVKNYQVPSVKGFDGDNRQLCTCNMLTLKQCSNKLCKMAHLLPTEIKRAYPEQLVNMMSMGVAAAVKKIEGGKRGMTIPNNPDYLSRPLGAECGNTAKGNSGGVGGGRKQQRYHDRGRRGGI